MRNTTQVILICILIVISAITTWLWLHIQPLPVAPNVSMLQNCDSTYATTRIYNYENKPTTCGYSVYMDVNDNKLLDTVDILLKTVPELKMGPQAEFIDGPIHPLYRYKGYSFIVKLWTDKLVTYYVSIPCDIEMKDFRPY